MTTFLIVLNEKDLEAIDVKKGIYLSGDYPVDYKSEYKTFLFNSLSYLAFNYCEDDLFSFFLVSHPQKEVLGEIHFVREKKKTATSLPRSPFGSLDFKNGLDVVLIMKFMRKLTNWLTQRGFKHIRIRHYPAGYRPGKSKIFMFALQKLDYTISEVVPNHHINTDAYGLESKFHNMEIRRLQKCRNADMICKEVPLKKMRDIYNFIKSCRDERGHDLSLSFERLHLLVQQFPERYKLFEVVHQGEVIAATIAVKVSDDILYNFYPASSIRFNNYSPMVLLISYMYDYARNNDFNMIDLGTSSLKNGHNFSLIAFKERVGGQATLKYTFEKSL